MAWRLPTELARGRCPRLAQDVDDLEDTSKLELYVEQSAAILIFASRGYFASVNCLREAVAATSQGKPIILMHDPDRARGGGPMHEIKAECDLRALTVSPGALDVQLELAH